MEHHGDATEARFAAYIDALSSVIGHKARRAPLKAYLTGLLLPGKRKSVEPMAARVDARRLGALHQSMHHFVANSPWDDWALMTAALDWALPALERHGVVTSWVVQEDCIRKKGERSVGVAHQRSAGMARPARCQIALSVWLVHPAMSIPAAFRLYLPPGWASSPDDRRAAGVPDDVPYRRRDEIVLEILDELLAARIPRAPVIAPIGYADAPRFTEALADRELDSLLCVDAGTLRTERPDTGFDLLQKQGLRDITSRFAEVPSGEDRLLIEWRSRDRRPSHAWFSSLPDAYSLEDRAHLSRSPQRAERDLADIQRELGLHHYEGRSWRGFHHHAALCGAAFSFLAAERAQLAPPMPLAFLRPSLLPPGFLPRGATRRW